MTFWIFIAYCGSELIWYMYTVKFGLKTQMDQPASYWLLFKIFQTTKNVLLFASAVVLLFYFFPLVIVPGFIGYISDHKAARVARQNAINEMITFLNTDEWKKTHTMDVTTLVAEEMVDREIQDGTRR